MSHGRVWVSIVAVCAAALGVAGALSPAASASVARHASAASKVHLTKVTPSLEFDGTPDPGVTGSITYEAVVDGHPGNPAPTGTVLVRDRTTNVQCTITLSPVVSFESAGTCSIIQNASEGGNPAGSDYLVDATYSGDSNYKRATSSWFETINKATPTVIVSGPGGATTGPVSYSVSVSGGGATPTGSVALSDGQGGTCNIAVLSAGAGSCSITENAGGSPFTVTATYSGDANYTTATGSTSETVGLGTPDVDVSGAAGAVTGPVSYSVTVTGAGATPTGSVTVDDDQGGTCDILSLVAGAGSCSITENASGSPFDVTASYSGDSNYTGGSGSTSESVGLGTPTVDVSGAGGAVTGSVTYSVTVTGAGATPTGSVTVSDGQGGTCDILSLVAGAGSCSITENASGSPFDVTASYSGDTNYNPGSGTTSEAVGLGTPDVNVSGAAGAVTGPVSYSVTVTGDGATPTGSVTVSDGQGGTCDILSLVAGAGSCSITENASGSAFSVTASYSGDTNYTGGSGTTSETVGLGTASVGLSANHNPATTGLVAYSATVTGAGATPSGTVGVVDGQGGSCTISLVAGSGKCSIAEAASGSPYSVLATYNGDGNYASGSTGSMNETVNKATPTLAISPSANPTTTGYVTYTVTAAGFGGIKPTGTVTVSDGVGGTCSFSLNPAGHCVLLEAAANSPLTVTANYGGDNNYTTASTSITETVNRGTPTVNATGTPGAVTGPVTYHTSVSGHGIAPTGTVTVTDSQGGQCTITLSPASTGFCSIIEQGALSPYAVTETYNGDANYTTATGTLSQSVGRAPSTTTVVASNTFTGSVKYTVTVTGNSGIKPTGTVTVGDNKGGTCSVTLAGGTGHCSIIEAAQFSPYTVTANYPSDGNYTASSSSISVTVSKGAPGLAPTASPNPSAPGPVTYGITVSGAAGFTPSGTVTVSDGVGGTCTITLSGLGQGTCQITETIHQTYTIVFAYNGDSNYNASSASLHERIT